MESWKHTPISARLYADIDSERVLCIRNTEDGTTLAAFTAVETQTLIPAIWRLRPDLAPVPVPYPVQSRPRAHQYAGLLGRYVDLSWPTPDPENLSKRGGMAMWVERVEDTEHGVEIVGDYGMSVTLTAENVDEVQIVAMLSATGSKDYDR